MKYRALSKVVHDGDEYQQGEEIEIPDAVAAALLKSGVIEPLNKPFATMRSLVSLEIQTKGTGSGAALVSLVRAVHEAADVVIGKIHEADREIAELEAERSSLTESPVSRAEFMEYVRADVERRGSSYKLRLKHWKGKWFQNTFAKFEKAHSTGIDQTIPYLSAENPFGGAEMAPDAVYWLFGDLIVKRFGDAAEGLPWPEKSVPVKERRARIASLDQQISDLQKRRDALSADLAATGMYA